MLENYQNIIIYGLGQSGISSYEKLKDLTRGEKIDRRSMAGFIQKLKISDESKDLLMALTPEAYIGNAAKVVESI